MRFLGLFRSSSSHHRSRKGRSEPGPTGNQDREATANNDEGITPPQPQPPAAQRHPQLQHHHRPSNIHLHPYNNDDEEPCPEASSYAPVIDVYEDRIEELGELMAEQGRCLDEVTSRSRRLSTENNMLRERLTTSMASEPVSSVSPARSPLKSVINSTQRKRKDENNTKDAVLRFKEENSLLIQQADLLANELTESNRLLAERDASLVSLGKELSSCLEKTRSRKIIHAH
jgi:hypothetical protein